MMPVRRKAVEAVRYLAVSVVALLVDMGCLLLAAQFVHYLWAATIGFVLGAVVSYWLAIRWAFQHRRLAAFPKTEFAAYAAIGVAGLILNNLVIYFGVEYIAAALWTTKLGAAAITFVFNFGLRKWGLFRP